MTGVAGERREVRRQRTKQIMMWTTSRASPTTEQPRNHATTQPRNHATTQPPNEMTPNTHRVEPDVGDLGLLDGEQQALVGRAAVCEDDMRDAEDGASE